MSIQIIFKDQLNAVYIHRHSLKHLELFWHIRIRTYVHLISCSFLFTLSLSLSLVAALFAFFMCAFHGKFPFGGFSRQKYVNIAIIYAMVFCFYVKRIPGIRRTSCLCLCLCLCVVNVRNSYAWHAEACVGPTRRMRNISIWVSMQIDHPPRQRLRDREKKRYKKRRRNLANAVLKCCWVFRLFSSFSNWNLCAFHGQLSKWKQIFRQVTNYYLCFFLI